MIITEQILKEAESINGAWSRKQLEVIGIKWPPPKGWKKEIIGTEIDDSKINKLLSLKNKHIEKKVKVIKPISDIECYKRTKKKRRSKKQSKYIKNVFNPR